MSDPTREACSVASLAAGEPLAGTASEARFFAALSWPKALWHADKIARSEGLPATLGELETRAKKSPGGLQLRLFQRAHASAERVELICADFASGRTAHLLDLPVSESAGAIELFIDGDAAAPALARPIVLVCTDGKHDLCCGKLGRGLVAALRAGGRVDVAEVSHLGGHRLAANALVLPTGELYGRVGVDDATALADAARHGCVYLPRYRGRTGLSELAQLAEAAARAALPDAAKLSIGEPASDGEARLLRVACGAPDARARIAVRCVPRVFEAIASCGDAEPERRERWVVENVREEPC